MPVLQLVKDPDTPKLTIKTDSKSSREYEFKDVQVRYYCTVILMCLYLTEYLGLQADSRLNLGFCCTNANLDEKDVAGSCRILDVCKLLRDLYFINTNTNNLN